MSPPGAPASSRPVLLIIGLDLPIAAWATTQYVAGRLGNHPNLGTWLYAASSESYVWWRVRAVLIAGTGLVIALTLRTRGASARRWVPALLLTACIAAAAAAAV